MILDIKYNSILIDLFNVESREKPGNDGKKGVIFIYIKN